MITKRGLNWTSPETLVLIILIVLFGLVMLYLLWDNIGGRILGL